MLKTWSPPFQKMPAVPVQRLVLPLNAQHGHRCSWKSLGRRQASQQQRPGKRLGWVGPVYTGMIRNEFESCSPNPRISNIIWWKVLNKTCLLVLTIVFLRCLAFRMFSCFPNHNPVLQLPIVAVGPGTYKQAGSLLLRNDKALTHAWCGSSETSRKPSWLQRFWPSEPGENPWRLNGNMEGQLFNYLFQTNVETGHLTYSIRVLPWGPTQRTNLHFG